MSTQNEQQNTFKTNLYAGITDSLYLRDEIADVHFIFRKNEQFERVPAHKIILSSASKVFMAMFYGDLKEKEEVIITDSPAEAFKEFLQIFYLDMVCLTYENIEYVVKLADKYDVKECMEICAEFLELNLTIENSCFAFELATLFGLTSLTISCKEHIEENILDVFETEGFLNCSSIVLERILAIENLNAGSVDIFNACWKWASIQCEDEGIDKEDTSNLRYQLGNCFLLIPFDKMSLQEFADCITKYPHLFDAVELMEIIKGIASTERVIKNRYRRTNKIG